MASHESSSNIFFPPYLLQDVFEHLDSLSLLSCKRVCTLWYSVICSRRRLCHKLFLPHPDGSVHLVDSPNESYELHPIFAQIHFDASLDADSTTFGRTRSRNLKDSPARDHYATYPPTSRVEMDLIRFHPHMVVENATGVRVRDVVEELARYKAERTHFTFQTFFRSNICTKRGYDGWRRMHRRDLLGVDSVFISFGDRVPEDGRVFVGDSFESRKGIAVGKKYRFWSAFAFCEFPS